jgi:hypothetical protein
VQNTRTHKQRAPRVPNNGTYAAESMYMPTPRIKKLQLPVSSVAN